ncbi:MAG: hypothetical protein ACOCQV_02835 [Halolamina sp.]
MSYIVVGAAVTLAVLVAMLKPDAAQSVVMRWQRYKEVIFLAVGGLTTYYFLTAGVWYLTILGAAGIVAVVWALWFADLPSPLGGMR